ncbi:MAG: radical SAM protein [Desulfobulbaceae bacterium]|nr:radical SAM protein [Desulfobulbaceae bacterium]
MSDITCSPSSPDHQGSWQYLDISGPNISWPQDGRRRVLLVAINMPGYYSLAVRILALVAAQTGDLASQVSIRYVEVDNTENMADLAVRLAAWQPDCIAWTLNIWNRMPVEELLLHLRPLLPQALFLFGGQEVTDSAVDFLQHLTELDYLIEGEGEIPFVQFLRAWLQGGCDRLIDPSAVSGLRHRSRGVSVLSRPAETVHNLDDLPSVILAGLIQPDQRNLLGVMLEGSRGCPNRCSFCFEGGRRGRVRSASVARLAEEAAFMAARGAGYFHILDPILCNSNPARLRELAQVLAELQRKNPRTVISVEIYAHQVSEELAECLKSCTIVDVGLQSTHEPTARAIHRAWQPERFRAGLARLRKAQVPFNIYLICGLPEETLATYLQGLVSIMLEQPTRIFCNELCLLNGTELRHRALEYGYHFDQEPPYRAWSNRWMTEADFALAQAASKVVEKRYNLTARAIHTKAPWLPGHAPEYGGLTRIVLQSPCSYKCPGCTRASAQTTALPDDLTGMLVELQDDDVELVVGDRVDKQSLMQLIGRLQLYAPARLRLVAPPGLFAEAEWVQHLVHRGVWHYRSFAATAMYAKMQTTAGTDAHINAEINAQHDATNSRAFFHLSQNYRLTGFALIRPFSEIILLLPQEPDAEACCTSLRKLADTGLTMLTLPSAAADMPKQWQEQLAREFCRLLPQLCWLRLPDPVLHLALAPAYGTPTGGNPSAQISASLQALGLTTSTVAVVPNQPPCFMADESASVTRTPPDTKTFCS